MAYATIDEYFNTVKSNGHNDQDATKNGAAGALNYHKESATSNGYTETEVHEMKHGIPLFIKIPETQLEVDLLIVLIDILSKLYIF